MISKVIFLVLFITINNVNYTHGQFRQGRRINLCSKGVPCSSINNCPSMLALMQSGERDKILEVQKNFCGSIFSKSTVCCKDSVCGRTEAADKIVGGNITSIGAYPWMVAIGYEVRGKTGTQFLCSGTLISERYVLTAAHCLDKNRLGSSKLKILHLGDWDLSTSEDCRVTQIGTICSPPHTEAFVEEVILHPDYNTRAELSDDIALIRMNRTVQFRTEINPICLPPPNLDVERVLGNRDPIATGWGITENNTESYIPRNVKLPLNDNQQCINLYQNTFVDKQLCVGGKRDKDTCKVHSGGSLVISGIAGPPYLLLGIMSFGAVPCGLDNVPDVYTSVRSYINWIEGNQRL